MDVKKLFTEETIGPLREKSRPEAIDRLKQFLGLEEIAKRESLTVEPEALEAEVEKWKKELSGQRIDPDRLRKVVESDLLKEKTLKWLQEHSTVELVPLGSLKDEEAEVPEEEQTAEPQLEAQPEAPEALVEPSSEVIEVEAQAILEAPETVVSTTPEVPETQAQTSQEEENQAEEAANKPKSRRKTKKTT